MNSAILGQLVIFFIVAALLIGASLHLGGQLDLVAEAGKAIS
jgi:hypothetical protein